ncbi:MAG: protein-L-isoaspartate(D-aspartate) O-methyltransferase [Planctomycetaceae bacterium]|nr:protein-L-isoaspartate(D-aspartate) O-methyltransferase [Planctomycetaceae bacterium]
MNRVVRCMLIAACAAGIGAPRAAQAQSDEKYRELRYRMVREFIEAEGVKNPRVLQSMKNVPRHEFTRPVDRSKAYFDGAWAIGYGQTISPPFVVAYMTESLDPQPKDKVLEIGTGSGYQAAVLSALVDQVYSIEIVEPLGRQAEARLKKLGYENVHTMVGDGYKGWPEHAPFDKIIVTCSPEKVPQPLVDQLKEGGRMIIPLGERYQQVFYLFEKKDGKLVEKKLIPTLFVPMTGQSEKEREKKPDPAHPVIVNGGFEADENADGKPDNWHYQRQATTLEEGAPEGGRCLLFENEDKGRLSQVLQGMGVDGSKIVGLRMSVRVKAEGTAAGNEKWEVPSLVVIFYDETRKSLQTDTIVGPWLGTFDWKQDTATITVPRNAREAVVRIGLSGATGKLWLDDVRMTPVPRK